MRLELTLRDPKGRVSDILAMVDPRTPVAELLRSGGVDTSAAPFSGSRPLDPTASVEAAGLRSGAVINLGRPGSNPYDVQDEGLQLRVIGGPFAGLVYQLHEGDQEVGRNSTAALAIPDPRISGSHLRLRRAGDVVTLLNLDPANGTYVADELLAPDEQRDVSDGTPIVIGQSTLTVAPALPLDGSVEDAGDGLLWFNCTADLLNRPKTLRMSASDAVEEDSNGLSVLVQLVAFSGTLLASTLAAIIFHSWSLMLLSTVGTLPFLLSRVLSGRGAGRSRRARIERLKALTAAKRQRLVEAAQAEEEYITYANPDMATLLLLALGPRKRLWFRRTPHAGIELRIGSGSRPASVVVEGREASEAAAIPTLHSAPVVLDLQKVGVIGIAAEDDRRRGLARSLVLQLATLYPPGALQLLFLTSEDNPDEWSWLRWLPHTRLSDDDVVAVGNTPATIKRRLDELHQVLKQRLDVAASGSTQAFPPCVVILDGARGLRSTGVRELLEKGPAVAIYTIAIDTSDPRLPRECGAQLVFTKPVSTVVEIIARDQDVQGSCVADLLHPELAERAARCMASLRPLGAEDDESLPNQIRFLDLAEIPEPTSSDVARLWQTSREGTAVVGVDEHGGKVVIDLPQQGPHALIAGTSGSGKSEFLRSLLTGLALATPPDRLNLLLIDFKGSGAFGKLEGLPHVVGLATDLNIKGPLGNRLLESLERELELRKELFQQAGLPESISGYWQASIQDSQIPPLARLVVAVDEFAELKSKQPDFVDGLIHIATVGRAYGVHLVLATQRPDSTVVSPQIKDNANLRVLLRVLDSNVSRDLTGVPDAAAFPNLRKGRALMVTGDGLPTVMQTAYVSGHRRAKVTDDMAPTTVTLRPWSECGVLVTPPKRAESDLGARSDLTSLVEAMSDAADELGYDKPRKPWLRPLNDSVSLAELPTVSVSPGHNPTLVIGVEDLPARQRQVTFGLSLGGGNLGLVGGKGSGRTTALRTIAAAAVQTISVDALHVYALDYGAEGGLASLAGLPHVAAVINRSQPQRAARLLRRLREEVARRGALLSRSGYGTVADYRLAVTEGAPPFLLLLLDSWEGFTGSGIPVEVREAFTSLVNDGRAAGVQVVTTGGKALAAPTIASGYESIVSLRFDNLEDYKTVGVRVSALPDKIPPGRAYRLTSGTALQLGYVGRSSETIDQNEFIRELASQIEVGQQHPAHLRVDELPAEITLQAALNLYGPAEGHAHETIVGVGGDELALIRADLSLAQPAFVIAGPAKSGRTNALALLAQQMLAKGLKLCLLHTDSDGVIAEVASRPDVFDVAPTQKRPLLDQIQDAAVLIDDVHRFPDGDPWVSSLLERQGLPVIIAGDSSRMWSTWSGWPGMARQSGAGLLLNPRKSAEGEVIGVQLEEGDLGPSHAGRAWFGWRGQGTLVQIPLAERETAHSGDGNRSNRKVPTKASKRRSNSSR